MLQHLTIGPEFAGKNSPLREEERKQLEENILADGVVINPLIVWNPMWILSRAGRGWWCCCERKK
ncbi:hypothetical protein B5E67_01850 [Faecalibacterium sp. An122]|nr:hypothetical protein B5E67_01850 [Faecalibacterium sp. An122]